MKEDVVYLNIKDAKLYILENPSHSLAVASVTLVSCINLSLYLYLAVFGGGYVIYVTPVCSCLSDHTSLKKTFRKLSNHSSLHRQQSRVSSADPVSISRIQLSLSLYCSSC